jgi:hypothetical protein
LLVEALGHLVEVAGDVRHLDAEGPDPVGQLGD